MIKSRELHEIVAIIKFKKSIVTIANTFECTIMTTIAFAMDGKLLKIRNIVRNIISTAILK